MRRLLLWLLARLGSRAIVGIGITLVIVNLLIPDPIPFVDEILMIIGTILLSRWAKREEAIQDPTLLKQAGRGRTQDTQR